MDGAFCALFTLESQSLGRASTAGSVLLTPIELFLLGVGIAPVARILVNCSSWLILDRLGIATEAGEPFLDCGGCISIFLSVEPSCAVVRW